MKKLLLASAVAALSISAQAAPTVYGKAFVTLDVDTVDTTDKATGVKTSTDGRAQLNSTGSRIGLKGSESVTANTDVVYQLEYRVDVDADKGNNFSSRDTYIGVANKQFGTVIAGRLTAIDDYNNYANVLSGAVVGGDNVLASFNGPRANNAIAYISPNYNGLHFKGMYVLDEFKGAEFDSLTGERLDGNGSTDTLARDAFGVSAHFEPQGANYRGGVSYVQAGDTNKIARVSGAVDITPAVTVGALYQNHNFGKNAEKENAIAVSGSFKTATPWTAYAQLDLVDNKGGVKDAESQRVAVGGKYAFNKAVTGHVYGAVLKDETAATEQKGAGIGGGIEYKF